MKKFCQIPEERVKCGKISYMYKEIIIEKDDVVPYIYFVCSMAQRGKMYGGLSGKSDYIGGIFDRWINIIPESVIFNKYFLPQIAKNLKVISDYYEYNPKKVGIAPDVLGINNKEIATPFVEYINRWNAIKNAPQIEVKSFKKAQYMVSLRNQGYDNKFLVMVEMNLKSDYLLPFFELEIISDEVYKKLRMNDKVFIKRNNENNLSPVTKIIPPTNELGSLKLITVCSAKDFMSYSNLCSAKESPIYLKNIEETRTPRVIESIPFTKMFVKGKNGLFSCTNNILDNNPTSKVLNLYIKNEKSLKIIKSSKSSVTIYVEKTAVINQYTLKAHTTYIMKFQMLDRSSNNGSEYFMHKSIIDRIPNKEKIMIDSIKKYINKK